MTRPDAMPDVVWLGYEAGRPSWLEAFTDLDKAQAWATAPTRGDERALISVFVPDDVVVHKVALQPARYLLVPQGSEPQDGET